MQIQPVLQWGQKHCTWSHSLIGPTLSCCPGCVFLHGAQEALPCHLILPSRTLCNSPPAATTPKSRKVDRTFLSRIGTVGMHSSVGRRRITTEAQVRSYGSPCDIYGGKSGTWKGFSACTASLLSTSTSHLFVYQHKDGQLA